jgi:5-methyltetrahydropteroyltriglutamate--homocysteine methyltransferase
MWRTRKHIVPRVRVREIWRVPEEFLAAAQDDATIVAIREQERAGIDAARNGEIIGRSGKKIQVPLVSGPIERKHAVEVADVAFLRAHTDRTIKITLPGPFTMTQQAVNEYYATDEALAFAFADAVKAEVQDLFAAGADVVQLDEPWLQARAETARVYGVDAINRALEGVAGTTALHLCFGYAAIVKDKPSGYSFLAEIEDTAVDQVSIEAAQPKLDLTVLRELPSKTVMVGALDLDDPGVETPRQVAARIRAALDHVPPERLIATPDCGMKYLPREVAFGKLKALADGAAIVNAEL